MNEARICYYSFTLSSMNCLYMHNVEHMHWNQLLQCTQMVCGGSVHSIDLLIAS